MRGVKMKTYRKHGALPEAVSQHIVRAKIHSDFGVQTPDKGGVKALSLNRSDAANAQIPAKLHRGKKGTSLRFMLKKYRTLYLLMLPGMLYYILFKYAPMYGVIIAFQNFSIGRGILGSKFVGLQHFIDFFVNTPDAWKLIRNTVMLNVYDLLFRFPAPIILALLFHEIRSRKFKWFTQSVSYMPHFLSTVVIAGIMVTFLSQQTGIVNHILDWLGLGRIMFLGEPGWFRTIYVGSEIWQTIGWGTILYLAAIAGVDPTLYEAAKIDGANRFQQMRHVTLIGMIPVMIVLFVLTLGHFMETGFQKIILLYNPMTYETADVLNTYIYRRGILSADFSFATAVGLFQSVIGFVLVVAANRVVKKFSDTSLW
jgi:putative aldouronate transport system permease protein